jgi:pSer/pThr/pTyr-binding forkhead associated (FHA) protein
MAPTTRDARTVTVPEAAQQAGLLRAPVVGLRVLGTTVEHRIPIDERQITIGSGEGRSIRLQHPSVSHLHAQLERRDHHLILVDCNSKNGCYAEGERRAVIHLVPGERIRLGEVELVTFSHASDDVRRVFQRYLGYDRSSLRAVEDAHHAAARHRHLVLLGPPGAGSVAFARSIHEHTLGAPWPLVFAARLHPGRAAPHPAQRFRDSYAAQKQALAAAGHGTLVLSFADLPADPRFLLDSLRSRASGTRAIFLGSNDAQLGALGALALECAVIQVPALAARRRELSRIVADAVAEHTGGRHAKTILTAHDHERLLAHDWPRNQDELEEIVARLIALRTHRRVRKAADALGLSPGSLSEWIKKYGFRVERWPGGWRRSDGV